MKNLNMLRQELKSIEEERVRKFNTSLFEFKQAFNSSKWLNLLNQDLENLEVSMLKNGYIFSKYILSFQDINSEIVTHLLDYISNSLFLLGFDILIKKDETESKVYILFGDKIHTRFYIESPKESHLISEWSQTFETEFKLPVKE